MKINFLRNKNYGTVDILFLSVDILESFWNVAHRATLFGLECEC